MFEYWFRNRGKGIWELVLILCQFCILNFNTVENISISCPQSNLNCFLLCTVNFVVKLLFLSGFCMIYCVHLGEGNIRNKCRVRDAVEVNFSLSFLPIPLTAF